MPPTHPNHTTPTTTSGHLADNSRCFACHRPLLYNILSYSQRYPNLVLILALLSTQRRLRLPKVQTPLLTPLLWYATAWSFVSRFALVGGYLWYALRDDPIVEEGARGGQAGQAQGQGEEREQGQRQVADSEGDGQRVEAAEQDVLTAVDGEHNEQESANAGDERHVEHDIPGGTGLSSDNLFDALTRSPTEDEVVPSPGQEQHDASTA